MRHQKWQSIQVDVTRALESKAYDLCTTLLSDALSHHTKAQTKLLETLCDDVARQTSAELKLNLAPFNKSRVSEIRTWFKRINRSKSFNECYLMRHETYVTAYESDGFDGVLSCIADDTLSDKDDVRLIVRNSPQTTLLNDLLELFVAKLMHTFQQEISNNLKSFYARVEVFVYQVGGDGKWAEPLLKLFLGHLVPSIPQTDNLQALYTNSDQLLLWCGGFMHGVTVSNIPSVLQPEFSRLLTYTCNQTGQWEQVNHLLNHVENLLAFEAWYTAFLARYNVLLDKPSNPPPAFTFLQKPYPRRFEFKVTPLLNDSIGIMERILLSPLDSHALNAEPMQITSDVGISIPQFSKGPSDAIVALSEYILTLPQYLDMFKDRNGFKRLSDDGVMEWTYFVANRVKLSCRGDVDMAYFVNVYRVIGLE